MYIVGKQQKADEISASKIKPVKADVAELKPSANTLVHLGAAYECIKLSVDLLEQYHNETGTTYLDSLFLSRAVLTGVTSWQNILQQVDTAIYDDLNEWLIVQLFVRRDANGKIASWWRLRRQSVVVPYDLFDITKTVVIHYYLPFGNLGRCELDNGLWCPHIQFIAGAEPYPGTIPTELTETG